MKAAARTARLVRIVAPVLWAISRLRAAAFLAAVVASAATGPALPYLTKRVVDALPSRSALAAGAAYLAVRLLQQGAIQLRWAIQFDVGDRVSQAFEQHVLGAALAAPGLEHLERPDFADKVQAARSSASVPGNFVMGLSGQAISLAGIVTSAALLASISPLLLPAPFLALPGAIVEYRSERRRQERQLTLTQQQRLEQQYAQLATSPRSAHEVRVFGLGDMLIGRYLETSARRIAALFRDRLRRAVAGAASGLLQGLAPAAGIALLVAIAARGGATAGDVVMGAQILIGMVGSVGQAIASAAQAAHFAFTAETYLWLLDYAPAVSTPPGALSPPDRVRDAIRVEHVTFAYPGTDANVLHDVTLELPAGATVALVGENGAGKTTLVKLLGRFYDADAGRITVDGADLRELDLDAWRARGTAVFQDFTHFQVLAREAIGFGDLPRIDDDDAVRAAAGRAGATAVLDQLPHGLDTQIGREFPGGVEVSEGQRQRIALARGSMREAPAVVILDEPTASLDAKAEAELFERFVRMSRPGDAPRPLTVLVSHRFSTVRMADLIVVMDAGRIVEQGSHDELMSARGIYAELYGLQASAFTS